MVEGAVGRARVIPPRSAGENAHGKVNTEILDYRGSINAYLDELSVVWICDWPRQIDALVDLEADGWEIYSQRGEYVCVTRVSAR